MKFSDAEIIESYIKGDKKGITIGENCFFMPLRITGLGKTKRIDDDQTIQNLKKLLKTDEDLSLDELVDRAKKLKIDYKDSIETYEIDRRPEEFSTPEALENYNGLPIVKGHPQTKEGASMLNYFNLEKNPIIGTIVKPYIKGDGVWGVAKIFDVKMIDEFSKYESTSPAIISYNQKTKNNGIIEIPEHFNHLAFVEDGHWDQKGQDGYDASDLHLNIGESEMAEEAKQDESTTEKVKDLEQAESKEAEVFEQLANAHKKIKKDETMAEELKSDNEVATVDERDYLPVDNVDEDEANVDTDVQLMDEEDDNVDEENCDTDVQLMDEEDDNVDEDKKEKADEEEETLDSEEETLEDEERKDLCDSFRKAIDNADPALKLKMPYVGARLSPSAMITKILRANYKYVDSKYDDLIIDTKNRRGLRNYSLLVDAYNNLLDNIEQRTNKIRRDRSASGKKGYWEPTHKPNVKIDRNF